MNRTPAVISGVVLVFASAWLGVAMYSYMTLGYLAPVADKASGSTLPPALSGLADAGQRVYAAEGCAYCHTQQVRPAAISGDIEKKLGSRRTVARDFLYQQPAAFGYLRIGPDLSNYGLRARDEAEVHRLLYQTGSAMPSYRSLYILRPISGQQSAEALEGLRGSYAPPAGYEVVPTPDARALAAYLLSLKHDYPLPEAPLEKTK